MRYFKSFLFFFLLILTTAFISLDDPADKLIAAAQKLLTDYPQEKVFLHIDKPYYVAGDTIWYKAYTVDARANQPSALSQVLYVELVNDKDSTVSSQKIKLTIGLGNAQIALPMDIKPGNYTLFAYTNWMKNFDKDFFFQKQLRIENQFLESTAKTSNVAGKPDLQFFPEGGYLVEGIRAIVAFKALDNNGVGMKVNGYIADQQNEKLIEFTTEHAGMGIFPFSPEKGKQYTAVITDKNGQEQRYPLPVAKPSGYVLTVNNRDSVNLGIKIALSAELVTATELIVLVQQNGDVKYVSKFMPKQVNNLQVPKSKLRTGIAQVTIFKNEEPLAERLVFVNHNDLLEAAIQADKSTYSALEQVRLNIQVTKDKRPVMGSFSVAVIDGSKVNYNEALTDNIVSNLLLTADIKGKVEAPGYYFNNNTEETRKHLDYLMLTQGWRRFSWKKILAGGYPVNNFMAEKGLSISGRIVTQNDKPLALAKATLLSSRGSVFTTDTITNDKGAFNFDEMGFADSTIFVVQVQKENGNKYVKAVFNKEPVFKLQAKPFQEQAANMESYIANSKDQYHAQFLGFKNGALQINAVEIKGEKKPVIKESKNLNGSGNADQVITADMLVNATSLTDYISKYVNGVEKFRGADEAESQLYFKRTGDDVFGNPKAPIQFVIDGMDVSQGFIDNFSVDDIEGVEVLKSAAFNSLYGGNGLGGTIIVTTKRGRGRGVETPGVSMIRPKGYQLERQFYSPKYSTPAVKVKDLRSTIYWNANVITSKDGAANVTFYNAAGAGNYLIILQGIDAEGNLAYTVKNYSVK